MYLARKITASKWAKGPDFSEAQIPADAVTADLRTRRNALSFWRCGDGQPGEVEHAALAIASAADRLEKIEVVWLAIGKLRQDGQEIQNSRGRTPVVDLVDGHVDVQRLDLVRLGRLAERTSEALKQGHYRLLTKAEVKRLLMNAHQQGRVDLEKVSQHICRELVA